jgi:hypothetical protein
LIYSEQIPDYWAGDAIGILQSTIRGIDPYDPLQI